ncbi:hypothetical protein CUR178_07201 [Leishmania enriettii]|uniref:Prefoldin subunit 2 n=1 Tax=Leishmania enriettii TaxID=5663 RepID=A0A836KVR3_LEIEN|nr:hypothetical protein CUR178_07201 [Leishmania enriettii]
MCLSPFPLPAYPTTHPSSSPVVLVVPCTRGNNDRFTLRAIAQRHILPFCFLTSLTSPVARYLSSSTPSSAAHHTCLAHQKMSTTAKTTQSSLTEEQIVQQYNRMRQEQSAIMSRIAELENESHEHDLVAAELRPLSKDRCCHHLVGGALVELTVGEVLPDIEENLAAIREALVQLNKGLLEKEKQMDEFMTKYKLNRPSSNQAVTAGQSNEGNRGVLA